MLTRLRCGGHTNNRSEGVSAHCAGSSSPAGWRDSISSLPIFFGKIRMVVGPWIWVAGSLQEPSAAAAVFPQSPLRMARTYSKRSRLTVLLRPQVRNSSLTKLRLRLVATSAIEPAASGRQPESSGMGGSPPALTTGG